MDFTDEQKERMGLSDSDADILYAAVEMIRAKDKSSQAGHLGAIMFSCHMNPAETMNTLMNLIKFTIDEHSLDGHKAAATKDVIEEFQGYLESIEEQEATAQTPESP